MRFSIEYCRFYLQVHYPLCLLWGLLLSTPEWPCWWTFCCRWPVSLVFSLWTQLDKRWALNYYIIFRNGKCDCLLLQNNRFDICCCVQVGKKNDNPKTAGQGLLYKAFENLYAPFLLSKPVRAIVVVVFFGWLCASIAVAPDIDVGLDQELSMPGDSYMLDYFSVSFQNSVTLLKNSWFSLLCFFFFGL